MALWLAIPTLLLAIEIQRTNGVYATLAGHWVSDFGQGATIFYLGLVLNALALALWWAFDRNYGPRRGDILWCHLMWSGLGLGAIASAFNWSHRTPVQVPWHLLAAAPIVGVVAVFFVMIVRGRSQ